MKNLSRLWQKLSRLWQKFTILSRIPGNVSVQNDNIGVWPGKKLSSFWRWYIFHIIFINSLCSFLLNGIFKKKKCCFLDKIGFLLIYTSLKVTVAFAPRRVFWDFTVAKSWKLISLKKKKNKYRIRPLDINALQSNKVMNNIDIIGQKK